MWSSNTDGHQVDRLQVEGDGNLILYSEEGANIWMTNTSGKCITVTGKL